VLLLSRFKKVDFLVALICGIIIICGYVLNISWSAFILCLGIVLVFIFRFLRNSPITLKKRRLVMGLILMEIITTLVLMIHPTISLLWLQIYLIFSYLFTIIALRPDIQLESEYEEFIMITCVLFILSVISVIMTMSQIYLFPDSILLFLIVGSSLLFLTIAFFSTNRLRFVIAGVIFMLTIAIKEFTNGSFVFDDLAIFILYSLMSGYFIEWISITTQTERKIGNNISTTLLLLTVLAGAFLLIFLR